MLSSGRLLCFTKMHTMSPGTKTCIRASYRRLHGCWSTIMDQIMLTAVDWTVHKAGWVSLHCSAMSAMRQRASAGAILPGKVANAPASPCSAQCAAASARKLGPRAHSSVAIYRWLQGPVSFACPEPSPAIIQDLGPIVSIMRQASA